MSTATRTGATDGLHALALLVTYPARSWLASRLPPAGRQPAAIHYLRLGDRGAAGHAA